MTPIESSEFNWSWEMLFPWLPPLLLLWGVVAPSAAGGAGAKIRGWRC
ncbi:MAG: hypothetical protein R3A10_22115 [Caldilineaceae bacterium]